MVRALLSALFFFTLIPRLTHAKDLKSAHPHRLLRLPRRAAAAHKIPHPGRGRAPAPPTCSSPSARSLDAFGAGILFMLSESLVALHVDRHERSRVMAIQRTP